MKCESYNGKVWRLESRVLSKLEIGIWNLEFLFQQSRFRHANLEAWACYLEATRVEIKKFQIPISNFQICSITVINTWIAS